MLRVSCLVALLTALCFQTGYTQEFQHCWSYRSIASPRYVRVNYENDLAFGTDYYFTQGAHFEYAFQAAGNKLQRAVFPLFAKYHRYAGIALESAGYTPTIIYSDSIRHEDRPFAGMAYLKAFSIGWNAARKERYGAALTIGLMGPAAGGYEIQQAIHKHTGNADPVGWKYQVGNALILNYELNYERTMFTRKRFMLSLTGTARAGTYSTKAAIGGILMAGWFENPYQRPGRLGKLQAYLFAHPQFDFVAYDASLQGSVFSDNSPYVISARDMQRIVYRFDGGLRFGYGRILLSIYARYLTKEFGTGLTHATGGAELAFMLDKLKS